MKRRELSGLGEWGAKIQGPQDMRPGRGRAAFGNPQTDGQLLDAGG